MRVILFQERFAPLVAAGTKRQTIRKTARCKAGDSLSLRRWSGKAYRSKQELLRTAVCTAVKPVRIAFHDAYVCGVKEDGQHLAALDGFNDWAEMRDWFEAVHGLPFSGWLIEWDAKQMPDGDAVNGGGRTGLNGGG